MKDKKFCIGSLYICILLVIGGLTILNSTIFANFDYTLGVEQNTILNNTASILDLDVLDNNKSIIKKLKKQNKTLIGYINAGSIENYREDYSKFPKSVIGKVYPGREDERFLDIRNYDKFIQFIIKYLDIAVEKGFDGIEFDNIDTYDNYEEVGFDFSQEDELKYLNTLEKETHKIGLKIYQKNAPELVGNLVDKFDGAIVEGGFHYDMIDDFLPYIKQDKKVFNVEYTDNTSKHDFINIICKKSQNLGITSILKNRDLDEFIVACDTNNSSKKIQKNTKISKLKLQIILKSLYETIDKRYKDDGLKINFLKTFNKKIVQLKQKKSKNKNLVEILDYLASDIGIKIKYYEQNISGNIKLDTSNILYKTDFENNITLHNPIADEDGVWWQQFSDKKINILGYETQLQFIVDRNYPLKNYANASIKTTLDNNGQETKALNLNIVKKQEEATQIPLITYTDGHEIEAMHFTYSLKFPKDLATKLGPDGWAVISEFKTTDDFRLAIYVYEDKDGELYRYMHGDNVVGDPEDYEEYWYVENFENEVPVGKWIDIDVFWKRGKHDGEVKFKVNNNLTLQYNGLTKIDDPLNTIMYFTNYASNPIDIWVDDFVVYGG